MLGIRLKERELVFNGNNERRWRRTGTDVNEQYRKYRDFVVVVLHLTFTIASSTTHTLKWACDDPKPAIVDKRYI